MPKGQQVLVKETQMGRYNRSSLRPNDLLTSLLVLSALSQAPPAKASCAGSRGTDGPQKHASWSRLRRRRSTSTLPYRPVVTKAAYSAPLAGLNEEFVSDPACEEGEDGFEEEGQHDLSDPSFWPSSSSSAEDSYESDEADVTWRAIDNDVNGDDVVATPGEDFSEEGEAATARWPENFAHYAINGPLLACGEDRSTVLNDGSSSGLCQDRTSPPATLLHALGGIVKVGATAAMVLAALAPLARALSSHWPYFVAGGICASVSHTAAVPLDVIKTRMQCAEPGKYRGTWDAFVRICRSEGAQVLFCGAEATVVGYAMQGCLKFGFFEFLKPFFSSLFVGGAWGNGVAGGGSVAPTETPVLGSLIAASVAAEVLGSSALTPLEAARIRMVADSDYAPGLRSGIARMISEEGLSALTRALPAVLAKQIPYTVTKLVTFDVFVRAASRASLGHRSNGDGGGGVAITACCAVAAGMLSSLASQPGDSLLSTLNTEGRRREGQRGQGKRLEEGGRERVESVTRAMVRIAREAGFSGLFRGTTARMMHVTSIVTVQLLIYQTVKSMVGISS
ncbi:unnamed protein product [Ascophyllum nodosum]